MCHCCRVRGRPSTVCDTNLGAQFHTSLQMETPEETLSRALLKIHSEDSSDSELSEAENEENHITVTVNQLRKELAEKTELCKKLQQALTQLLAKTASTAKSQSTMLNNVTKEHITALVIQYPKQIWFSNKVPRLIYAIYLQLANNVTSKITNGELTAALTFEECVELVDTEVRAAWAKKLPLGVEEILKLDTKVYPSNSELSNKTNGKPCCAGHFIVFIIRKLHNHVTNFMHNWKQAQIRQDTSVKVKEEDDSSSIASTKQSITEKVQWHHNPVKREEFKAACIGNATTSKTIPSTEECVKAIEACEEKLASKKITLMDKMKQIASLVSLQDQAAANGWKIPCKNHKINFCKLFTTSY